MEGLEGSIAEEDVVHGEVAEGDDFHAVNDGVELSDIAAHGLGGEDEANRDDEGEGTPQDLLLFNGGVGAEDLSEVSEGDAADEMSGGDTNLDETHEEGPGTSTTDGEVTARAASHDFIFLLIELDCF